jgi:lipopolysaccharide transport system permease protein
MEQTEIPVATMPSQLLTPVESQAGPADELPVTVIERKPGWQFLDLRELFRYRELLFFLALRDVKIRYKQTVFGVAWAVLQPVATMVAFSLFLGRVAGSPDATIAYPLFVFCGLLPWTFFASAVSSAGMSVVANERLVTKVYFPRQLMPLASVAAAVLDMAIAFGLLAVLMPFFGVWPGWEWMLLPLVLAVLLCLAMGLGSLLSALTVSYRDFRVVVPLAIQLWMFATPAIFLQDLSVLGPRVQSLLPLNPLHGVVVNFRGAMVGEPLDWPALLLSAGWAIALLLLGSFYFRRVERGFADLI